MNINQRIREIRKELHMNQRDFGKRIGLKHGAISKMEQDGSTVIDQNIHLICSTFHISEVWLRTGVGDMRQKMRDSLVQEIAKRYELDDVFVRAMTSFLLLNEEKRDAVFQAAKQVAEIIHAAIDEAGEGQEVSYDAVHQEIVNKLEMVDHGRDIDS